jgi:hypothetical protein
MQFPLMLWVLLVGLILGALVLLGRWLRWREYCKARADTHREAQVELELMADGHQPSHGFHPYLSAKYRRLADYHAQLRQKWETASSHPWEPVAPDPPEPK